MTDCWVGIDPGLSGGIAIITPKSVEFTAMIMAGKDLNLSELAEWLYTRTGIGTDAVVCIEKVGAMPGQGVTSMFKFGFVTGAIHGILATIGLSYHLVTPQAWKKEILAGTAKDKNAAIDYITRAYPSLDIRANSRCKKPHDGIADAICIAEYCRRHYP